MQRRRRRLRKRHLQSEFALPQTWSHLFHLVKFVKRWQSFLQLNSNGLHQSSGKEKERCCFLLPSSTKREIRQFRVVVVQRRQRNVQKNVMHVQSCCFACLNLLLFFRSLYCRRRRYFSEHREQYFRGTLVCKISIRQSNCCIEISITRESRLKIRSNVHVWPPSKNIKISPLKALKLEPLVNGHLLSATATTFLEDGFIWVFQCF